MDAIDAPGAPPLLHAVRKPSCQCDKILVEERNAYFDPVRHGHFVRIPSMDWEVSLRVE
jgi:hypothetical protein